MPFEVGQRVVFRSLHWEVADTSSASTVDLFGRRAWKALHDAYRLTLSHGRGHLGSVDWGRLVLEPYQLVPLRRIERLPFPRLMLVDDTGLGKTAEAGMILFRLLQRRTF